MKQIKALLKDEESIFLTKKSKGADISRAIYDLIHGGIKGEIKKEALLIALAELTVRVEINKISVIKCSYFSVYSQGHCFHNNGCLSSPRHRNISLK